MKMTRAAASVVKSALAAARFDAFRRRIPPDAAIGTRTTIQLRPPWERAPARTSWFLP